MPTIITRRLSVIGFLAKGGTIVGQNHVKIKMAYTVLVQAIVFIGGPSRDRTVDLLIKSQLLYQLS